MNEIHHHGLEKFNLDGPDGLKYYWHNLRIARESFSKREQKKKSVMICMAISYKETIDLLSISCKMNAEYYLIVLDRILLPTIVILFGEDWKLQQDKASVHIAPKTEEYLQVYGIDVLQWLAMLLDLNITENFRGLMAR